MANSIGALSTSWFHSWLPPTALLPDSNPESRLQLQYPQTLSGYDKDSGMKRLIPYLLTLGVIAPSTFQQSPPISAEDDHREKTGPFTTVYQWNLLDFQYNSLADRQEALASGSYVRENNLPLGIDVWMDRIFVSMPKWKEGVPATLAWIPRHSDEISPKLRPYPSWEWHTSGSCSGITSVFRLQVDECGRLWVLDSGLINVTIKPEQICPPQILVFDLATDKLIRRHVFKEEFVKQDSLYSNIVVDVRGDDCENVHAYAVDVWRYGILVYSFEKDRSWRVTNHLFFPNPLAAAYKLHELEFNWMDGIFGLSLSPYDKTVDDRILYFHAMSSFREFYVKTSVICNETGWEDAADEFKVLGQSRGKNGHASASAMDRNGILYFNLVTRDSVGCWDSRKAYKRDNIGVVAQDSTTIVFPNDLRLDKEERQGLWVISNRLPFYLYKELDPNDVNFRIMHAYTDTAIQNTICDPNFSRIDSYSEYSDDIDCY